MDLQLSHIALVALGGALGSLGRHVVTLRITRSFGAGFPWGTFAVNLSGAALIGALWGVAGDSRAVWAGLAVGVLGSYTTVSSFALQTDALWSQGARGRAVANVALSLTLCPLAVVAGRWLVAG